MLDGAAEYIANSADDLDNVKKLTAILLATSVLPTFDMYL
jgi:hypothetical protein